MVFAPVRIGAGGLTVPAFMRAILLTGNGGFDTLDLRSDVAVPALGPDDVLIKIGAAGVNNTDINTRIGWYSKAAAQATDAGILSGIAGAEDDGWSGAAFQFPRIQGADACGQIVAVGANIDRARIGERVLVEPVFRGSGQAADQYFGSEVDGAFAEYARVPSVHAHRIDSGWSDAELASFPCAYCAAENMISRIDLTANETVLITGASGGVGSAAVQLAKRRGAKIVAMAGADKAEAMYQLGADQVIGRDADLAGLFGGEYFDAAVDVVGGTQFGAILNSLKRGGRYSVAGAISGPMVDLDLRTLYLKDLRLFGCTIFAPEIFKNLLGYIERKEIKPMVARIFPLADIVAAQKAFLSKAHAGKIVLLP